MPRAPHPLFDTFERFHALNFLQMTGELPVIRLYLEGFDNRCRATDSYLVVRSFLKSYSGNRSTFNSFRTHVERLLLWALIVAQKPLLELRRSDAEHFMEFCLSPPDGWVGPVVKSRFIRNGGRKRLETDEYQVNPNWRPFCNTVTKRERTLAVDTSDASVVRQYQMAQGSVAQVFAVCGSFFQHAMDEGLTEANPFRAIKQKSVYKQRNTSDISSRSLTELQWSFVIETAEAMATGDARHERTLFLVATLFAMYLRVSDLVGRDNWRPTMGDFRRDTLGNWWFHVVGKGNKAAKISVREDYIAEYLIRYRMSLQLPPLPSPNEKTPLIATLKGRGGLSDRHIRVLLQLVFDEALRRMQCDGWSEDEVDHLRSASLHWLRHTAATFDAPFREMKDLQADLRHNSLNTTQNTYYNSLDEQRARSVRGLKMKR